MALDISLASVDATAIFSSTVHNSGVMTAVLSALSARQKQSFAAQCLRKIATYSRRNVQIVLSLFVALF